MDIRKKLFSLQDVSYGDFQSALMPNIERNRVIGVRMPQLRAFARELKGCAEAKAFLTSLPHSYYEENILHVLLLEQIRDYEELLAALDRLLPYVDNWATCDTMRLKLLSTKKEETLRRIIGWLDSPHCYAVRFAIGLLMRYFLAEDFREEYMRLVSKRCCEEYYINMMVAWYFATALCKQYDFAIRYLEEGQLSPWVHSKTIQKAVESYRITPEQKAYLRSLRHK